MLCYTFSRHCGIEIVTHPFSREKKNCGYAGYKLRTFSFSFFNRDSLLFISYFAICSFSVNNIVRRRYMIVVMKRLLCIEALCIVIPEQCWDLTSVVR